MMGCIATQKLYGRDTANAGQVTEVFHTMLADYPADKVVRAFETWLSRSQEFPTPADIIGLIQRNGRPPLSKERYIAINKKDGEYRTPDDWQYLRDYEAEQDTGWGGETIYQQEENTRLRQQLAEAKIEIQRLNTLVHDLKVERRIEKPAPSVQERVMKTVEYMRQTGAQESDIEEFLSSQHMEAA